MLRVRSILHGAPLHRTQSLVKFIFSLTQAHDVDIFRSKSRPISSPTLFSCGMDKLSAAVLVIAADFIVHLRKSWNYANPQFALVFRCDPQSSGRITISTGSLGRTLVHIQTASRQTPRDSRDHYSGRY